MSLWPNPKKLFKAKVPDLKAYIGRVVRIPEFALLDGNKECIYEHWVKIKTIVGNRFKPNFYEINGEYLVGMLRFHAQMEGARDITEQQFQEFEEMEVAAERLSDKPDPSKLKVDQAALKNGEFKVKEEP